MKRHLSLVVLLIGFQCLIGAPLKNIPVQLKQPNGQIVNCFASGDEFYNYLHDENGFTIVQGEGGYYVYATNDAEGKVVPTTYIVGETDPSEAGLQPYIKISKQEYYTRRHEREQHIQRPQHRNSKELNHGLYNNLVVFIRFAGDTYHNTPFSTVETMFNADNFEANSLHNYYHHTSYNQLDLRSHFAPQPDGETILSYEDIHPKAYYQPYDPVTNPIGYHDGETADREFSLLERAIAYVEDMVPDTIDFDYNDDGKVDNVVFVVKGETGAWASLLWPHRWCIYDRYVPLHDLQVYDFNLQLEQGGYFNVSTLCHEMFHSLGAPDLYHYDDNIGLNPIGSWDLMCSNSEPPQQTNVYMKYKYGNWVDYIPMIDPEATGTYELESVAWEGGRRNGYMISIGDPDQFFFVEYRNKSNVFDKMVPGSGMLIYLIDTRFDGNASWNGYDYLDEVYVFRPGGDENNVGEINQAHFNKESGRTAFNVSTDPHPFKHNQPFFDWQKQITNISQTGDRMSFDYMPYGGEGSAPGPENFFAHVNSLEHQVELSWNACPNAGYYYVYRDGIEITDVTDTTFVHPYTEADNGYHIYSVVSVDEGQMHVYSAESKAWVILGGFETIDINIHSASNYGTLGGELEVSFDNPSMKTQYLTIYDGVSNTRQLYVPSNTEVTFRWLAGFDPESEDILVSAMTTNLNGQSTIFQINGPEEGILATYTVAEGQKGVMSPQNLTAISDGTNVQLHWVLPVEADHFVVYRDEKILDEATAVNNYFDETVLRSGAHKYRVESSNGATISLNLSNHVFASVLNDYCEPPRNLHGIHGDNGTNELEWEVPQLVGNGLLAYDPNEFLQGFGDKKQKWGIKFTPEQLARFGGRPLTHLELFDGKEGSYVFRIYNGEAANNNNQIYTMERQMNGSQTWVRFALDEVVTYDPSLPLWIGVDSPNVENPIPCGAYTGDDNGALVRIGGNWKPITYYGFYFTWLLRAYTQPAEGTNDFTYRLYWGPEDAYNYQMAPLMEGLSATSATHNSNDDLRYNVTAVWNGRETDFSNSVYLGPSVSVPETIEPSKVKVYPNPTQYQLQVEGQGLQRVTLYNLTGQIIYDRDVQHDHVTLPTSSLSKGIYLLNIRTHEGTEMVKVIRD